MKLANRALTAALAAVLGLGAFMMPSASAYCGRHYTAHRTRVSHTMRVVRTHVSRRVINRVVYAPPVVRETIVQPAVVEPTATVVSEPILGAAPVCRRRHHHLLGVDTPIFGFHLF